MSGTMTGLPGRRDTLWRGARGRARRRRRLVVIVGLPAVLLAAAGAVATPAAAGITYSLAATIGVGSGPDAVGVDPVSQEVFVANFGDNTVSVIDENTNTVTATVAVRPGSRGGGHRGRRTGQHPAVLLGLARLPVGGQPGRRGRQRLLGTVAVRPARW